MKRHIIVVFLAVWFIILGLCSSVNAEWWRNEQLQQKLQLTETQVQQMDQIFNAYRDQLKLDSERSRTLQGELNKLLAQETLDEQAITQTVQELNTLRSQMFEAMIAMKLAVRKVLTPEQLKQILTENPNIFTAGARWIGSGQTRNRSLRQAPRGKVDIENIVPNDAQEEKK